MRCQQCRGDSPNDALFCIACGAALTRAATGVTQQLAPLTTSVERNLLPQALRQQLAHEAVFLLDEGVRGSATYRNFRAPGRYSLWSREHFEATLAITTLRVLALANTRLLINVPWADPRIHQLRCSLARPATLCITFDPALFHTDWSGEIAYRFETRQAAQFLATIQQRIDTML